MSRISLDEARELWLHADDEELKARAQAARARFHEPDRATYMVMRIINYTNVCVAQCDYCAFYVLPNQDGGYVLSREDVFAKIDGLLEAYRETLEKHGLRPPPGYGVAGAGNAVFSVSSFMDTLAPEVVTTEEAVPA